MTRAKTTNTAVLRFLDWLSPKNLYRHILVNVAMKNLAMKTSKKANWLQENLPWLILVSFFLVLLIIVITQKAKIFKMT